EHVLRLVVVLRTGELNRQLRAVGRLRDEEFARAPGGEEDRNRFVARAGQRCAEGAFLDIVRGEDRAGNDLARRGAGAGGAGRRAKPRGEEKEDKGASAHVQPALQELCQEERRARFSSPPLVSAG